MQAVGAGKLSDKSAKEKVNEDFSETSVRPVIKSWVDCRYEGLIVGR